MSKMSGLALVVVSACGWDTPHTGVVVENDYPAATANVIVQAFWQSISFTSPIPPGTSSTPETSIFASPNTAYVLLAPRWDPSASTPPTSFVVLESNGGFALHVDMTLTIPVDDTTFTGNCTAGSFLSQAEADFITQNVFAQTFAGLHYDAATCTTTGP
jgi:hypothetical protein